MPSASACRKAVGVAVYGQRVAVGEGAVDPGPEPGLVYGLVAAFGYAKGDLALRVVEGAAEEAPARSKTGITSPGSPAASTTIGAVDPGVPRTGARGPCPLPRPLVPRCCKLLYQVLRRTSVSIRTGIDTVYLIYPRKEGGRSGSVAGEADSGRGSGDGLPGGGDPARREGLRGGGLRKERPARRPDGQARGAASRSTRAPHSSS